MGDSRKAGPVESTLTQEESIALGRRLVKSPAWAWWDVAVAGVIAIRQGSETKDMYDDEPWRSELETFGYEVLPDIRCPMVQGWVLALIRGVPGFENETPHWDPVLGWRFQAGDEWFNRGFQTYEHALVRGLVFVGRQEANND